MYMGDALEEARDIETRIADLEREVKRIKSIQQRNLPAFKEALDRIAKMRETIHTHSNSLMRLEKLAQDGATANAATAESIAELVAVLKGAKTATGWFRRHWRTIATAIVSLAIGRGWITIEDGKSIGSLFGF